MPHILYLKFQISDCKGAGQISGASAFINTRLQPGGWRDTVYVFMVEI
jgi:hypothetical protein